MANELGTIYCNEVTSKWHESPTIAIETAFGRIVASITGDAGIYDEIAIDLVAPDGRDMQLAVIGVTENSAGIEDMSDGEVPAMHAYIWNGIDEDCTWSHDIVVDKDKSMWW